jgi:hypothetical protein
VAEPKSRTCESRGRRDNDEEKAATAKVAQGEGESGVRAIIGASRLFGRGHRKAARFIDPISYSLNSRATRRWGEGR